MNDLESTQHLDGEILAFDIGLRRIGMARVNTNANIPEPLQHLEVTTDNQLSAVVAAIEAHKPVAVVIGLPRGLDGQETAQTKLTREFINELKLKTDTPLYWIDEAGTSKEAVVRLKGRAGNIDSVAAMIMLEDFMNYGDRRELLVE